MRLRDGVLLLAIACFLLFAPEVKATDYAYGYTSVYVDSGNVVRGYHRTEVDYNTDVYYRPYVCASLYKDGVEVVRACGGGFASATRNTQTTYYAGSTYSALTDHYVNIEYEEEDPYNPGYYYYSDVFGYNFSGAGSQPIDWYYVASGIYNTRPDESIHLGDTNVGLLEVGFLEVRLVGTNRNSGFTANFANLIINTCNGDRFSIKTTFQLPPYSASCCSSHETSFVKLAANNKFQFAPNLIDDTTVDWFGNDTPPYVIIYLKRRADGGGTTSTVNIRVGGLYQNGTSYSGQGTVRLVCE